MADKQFMDEHETNSPTEITEGDYKGVLPVLVKPKISTLSRFAGLKRGNTIGVGRKKGLESRIKEQVGEDGEKLVKKMCKFAFGHGHVPKIVQLKAVEWLADRGFGKSVSTLTLQNPDGTGIMQAESMSVEELRREMIERGELGQDGRLIARN